jgi:hypothetical protein
MNYAYDKIFGNITNLNTIERWVDNFIYKNSISDVKKMKK